MLGNSGRLSGMKNIFKKKPDKGRLKMEFVDYLLMLFITIIIGGLFYFLMEIFL